MATVTLSSKHQITLPVEVVRNLGLKPGAKLVVELVDDHLVLVPRPESWADYLGGSTKGVYGSTREEIERYIAEVRQGWDIDALKDALALDPQLRAVYDATSATEARSTTQIAQESGVARGYVDQYLGRLEELHAAKRMEHPTLKGEPYYRRIP